jgi:hypothetical protein
LFVYCEKFFVTIPKSKSLYYVQLHGAWVSKIQFIKLKQIEKELGTMEAMRDMEIMKDGFKFFNSLIIRKKSG